ncbi:Coactosin [Escovopsis weberi]|uniref:Coactosin n=1 Tax=Escovopsis weberi TaxID=150374 RepID=A0A0M9VWM9_ESCWE|nr:Coactosin [Escovopsis weberi]
MSGLDDPSILAAYERVRDDRDPTDYILISYAAATGSKLTLTEAGSGGLGELVKRLDDKEVQYAYVRVEYANDKESTRVKFVVVTWIGEGCKVMRKAKVSVESSAVKDKFTHHRAITASERSELREDDVVTLLRRSGGADYNGGRG